MYYIFIINPLGDRLDALPRISAMADREGIEYEIYRTEGEGDATRYVNLTCDIYPDREICFVACGGSGTIAEVISGIVGREDKFLAVYPCGSGRNFTLRSFPKRDFNDMGKMVGGTVFPVDIIKVNDNYAVNFVKVGRKRAFLYAVRKEPAKAFRLSTLVWNAVDALSVSIDGREVPGRFIQMLYVAGGRYVGEKEPLGEEVKINDGELDVSVVTLSDIDSLKPREYVKARHIEMTSQSLIYASLDGETVASTNFVIDVLPGAVKLILPGEK